MKIKPICFSLLLYFVITGCTTSTTENENTKLINVSNNTQYIDIGGYSVYTKVLGEGSPTVVFECGGGNTNEVWNLVQPEIAKITQTFSYDRPGIGMSDESPLPRTALNQVKELRLLLEKAKIEPPYVFVPNSYGAFISILFAYMYPDDVSGIVFVDGTSEKLPKYIKEYLSFPKFPIYKFVTRSNPDGNFKEISKSAQEIAYASKTDGLRNTPLIILTSDIKIMAEQFADLMTVDDSPWMDWQNEIASLSNISKHYIIYGSGHMIHMDNPKVVIKAIKKLLNNEYSWDESYTEPNELISLAPEKMQEYVGRYLFSLEDIMTIEEEKGHFYVNMSSFNKTEILPVSEKKVILKDKDISFELVRNQESDNDFLVISGKYLMDTIIAQRIDKNHLTPHEKLVQGNIDEAIEIYKKVYEIDPLNIALTENRFNTLGYELLNKEKYSEAIAIFMLNTEFYPESSNTFDSLAEAYMRAGKDELSISNYEISLRLNPENENAKKMLVQLKKK